MTVRDSCNDSLNIPKSLIYKRNDRYDGCDSFFRVLRMAELQGLGVGSGFCWMPNSRMK